MKCFGQEGAMSTLNGKTLKLVDLFIYLNSNISSTENDTKQRRELLLTGNRSYRYLISLIK